MPKDMLTRVVPISETNRQRVETWGRADAVDAREREWVRSIEAIRGNAYPFVKESGDAMPAKDVHGFKRFHLQHVRRGLSGARAAFLEAICPVGTGVSARRSA